MPGIRALQDPNAAGAPLWRNPGFMLLLGGSSVSMLGSRLTTIAYPLLVLFLTGSPVMAGWACFAATAPSVLVYLPAGALVDRCNPRLAMLICESFRGLTIASVVAALLASELTVTQLIVAAVVEEGLEVFSTLAERRLTRSLVNADTTASALAQTEARTHMAVMIGRPLGAFFFGIAHPLPFIADSATFAVSVLSVLGIKKSTCQRAPKTRLTHEIGEGLHWLWGNPFARIALPLTAGTTLIAQALIMIFLGEAHRHHLTAFTIGMILAASGAGGALGSAVAPRLFRDSGYSLFRAQLTGWVVTFIALALSGGQSFFSMAAAMLVLGFTGALGNIALDTYVVRNSEETIQARIMSVSWLVSMSAMAVGPLLGGVLLKECGARAAVLILFIGVVLLRAAAPDAPAARAGGACTDNPLTELLMPNRLGLWSTGERRALGSTGGAVSSISRGGPITPGTMVAGLSSPAAGQMPMPTLHAGYSEGPDLAMQAQ